MRHDLGELKLKSQEVETYLRPERNRVRFTPIRKALPYTTEKGDVCRIHSLIVITCAVCVCKCVHVCVCECTMYEMHIHLMGHYICRMYSVVMSKGKALCCELRTGSHMETTCTESCQLLHVRTQKPSLNRVQKFTIESCMCVCTKIIGMFVCVSMCVFVCAYVSR